MELRVRAIDKAYGGIKNGNIIDVICYDTNFKLVKFSKDGHEKTKHFVELEQLIIKNNYKFIGLDPLISLQTGSFDENNNPQMDAFCKTYLIYYLFLLKVYRAVSITAREMYIVF